MFKLAVIFALAFVACHGSVLPSEFTRTADVNIYWVYRRATFDSPTQVAADATKIPDAIEITKNTVFLIHGHNGNANNAFNDAIRRAVLGVDDVNVVVVDWARYASGSYSSALDSVDIVARSLVNFISVCRGINGFNSQIHIVGFNLGAHIAGIAGRVLIPQVARITGLDPSGSNWGSSSNRLRATDASYVEVIHTDGSGILANGIGDPIGRVNFYVNGGSNQPGCLTNSCSHERAHEVFAASFVNPTLEGRKCSTNLQLTLNRCSGDRLRLGTNIIPKFGDGTYRVNTGRSHPF